MSNTSKTCTHDAKLSKKDVLRAVVLADDFTTNLNPVHNVCPSVLMPVVNARLLDYLVETLKQSQIQELYIYGSNHVEMLKEYIEKRIYGTYKDITVTFITSRGCWSLGDALREIDTNGWIRGDFVLIRGDAFTNANLQSLMALHRKRCEKDKGTAATLVFRDLGSTSNSPSQEQACLFVANKSNKKVLFHKKLAKDDKKVKLELQWFLDHEQVEINSSFVDTHIYLCSPSVLSLFADNFDFQTMEDFIKGVLMNEEILDARIYWQPLNTEEYALPITSWQAYHTLSRDILQRQGYPLTPDMLPLCNIVYMSRSTYKHGTATLAHGCTLQRDTLIGKNSVLGKNTFVTRSVISEDCSIGENVQIKNSYLLSNVTIKDNSVLESCVVFPNCELGENVELDGCIVSQGVNLPSKSCYADVILESKDKKIVATKMSKQDVDYMEEILYFKRKESDNYDNDSESESSSSETSFLRGSPVPDDTNMFLSEVIDSLLRGYQDKLNCDNLILEINSSRYAYNVGIREVTYNVVKAILMLPVHYTTETKTAETTSYQKTLKVMITYFNPILLKYIKTEDAQEDCLRAIQDVALTSTELLSFVQALIHLLYERDMLSEEKILEWYDSVLEGDDEMEKEKIDTAIAPFIKWLKEAEEVSSSEDDDDD